MASANGASSSSASVEKLPRRTKLAYAVGEIGYTLGPGTVIAFWYTFFLTDVARLNLGLVSLFWFLVTLWDAVNDPVFGFLSDRTRSRWGRRRPYLLFGALPLGAIFVLLWLVPPVQSQGLLFAYYTVVYILFEAAFTAVSCPYIALTPELTLDHDERTSLVTYRMAFNIGASLIAPVVFSLLVFPMFPARDPRAFWVIGLICGAISVPPFLIAFFATRERPEFQAQESPPLTESIRFVMKNVVFRYTLAIRVLSWMPVVIAQAVFAYFLIYWTGLTEDGTSLVQGVILAVAFVFLPVVLWLARRLEKKTAYIIAASTWAVVMLGILLVPQGVKWAAYLIAALAGFGVSAAHVIPRAMDTDVLEVDELLSGKRQEGAYTGVTVFVDKLARSVILALLPAILHWSGYVQPSTANPSPVQPTSALTALRILISVLPAVLLVASIAVAARYPITRQRYGRIRKRLAVRRLRRETAQRIKA
ncbi:MAG: MFS transporter [Chloroflexi bacterium]|nr:MFS transporter [Chloroflexota bacterium]